MEDIEQRLKSTETAAMNAAALHFLVKASERAVKDKILVLSPGGFSGNSKYIYGYLHKTLSDRGAADRLFWIGHSKEEVEDLRSAGINAHHNRQDARSMKLLIESKLVFMSTHHFPRADYCVMQAALSGAKKIQMWHGVPAKHIAYELADRRSTAVEFSYYAYDCLSADFIVTESDYVTPRYLPGFPNAKPIVSGSARTDILLAELSDFPFWSIGTSSDYIERMKQWRQSGRKVVLYAPTYREVSQDRSVFFNEIRRLVRDLERYPEVLFVIKNHNASRDDQEIENIVSDSGSERIVLVPRKDDSYPYLRETDILVTDYSSIYYDFLLTNRRVVFFQPDYEAYTSTRKIYDEQEILGKPLGFRVSEGEACAKALVEEEPDDFARNRKEVRDRLFKAGDGNSSQRLIASLEEEVGREIFGRSEPSFWEKLRNVFST